MSAAGRPSEDAPGHAAAAVRDAGFVRLVGTADGDALAATGLVARALAAVDTPYQASVADVPEPPATDADCVVAVGHERAGADAALVESPVSVAAADVADDLAPDAVDPTLALAGGVCAGAAPSGRLLEAAGLERRPGVAVPTADPAEGLAASTLVHAGFSGDEAAAASFVDRLDGDDPDRRALASAVALAAVEDAAPRAAESVQRALRPRETERFETLGGYADVLSALAADRPGVGIALALGRDVEDAARSTWREHGHRAHEALRLADTGRYDGFSVARVDADAPLSTVARLQVAYRSPEPVALALADGRAAVVAADGTSVATPVREAAAALDGRAAVREGRGAATFDGTANDYLEAFREAR
jgi:hypothetical protein